MILSAALVVIYYLIFFSDFLTANYGSVFGYGDEFLAFFLLCLAMLVYVGKGGVSLSWVERKIVWLLVFVVGVGCVSSCVYSYQGFVPSLVDAMVFVKAFVVYFSTRIAFEDVDVLFAKDVVLKLVKFSASVLLFVVLVDQAVGLFPKQPSFFFGFSESELWFVHSSRLAFASSMLFCLIVALSRPGDRKILAFLSLFVGVFTFKQKFISFALIAAFVFYFESYIKTIGRGVVLVVVGLIGTAVLLSMEKIAYYFSDDSYISGFARAVLTRESFFVANDHFPLGSGFGTFGTHVSGADYSDLYYVYGIDNIFGLTRDDPMFVTDVYWPMILAQFGYFCVVLMLVVFSLFLYEFIRLFNSSISFQARRLSLAMLLILMALIIDTAADQIVSQNRGVVAMFMMAILMNARCKIDRFSVNLSEVVA